MLAFKRFMLALLVLGVFGGVGFGVLWFKQRVEARSLDGVVVEPAPPQPKPQEKKKDGARLLYAPEDGQRLSAAAFIDNDTLIVSASSGSGKEEHWKLMKINAASGTPATLLDGSAPRLASSHRPAHGNAGRLCYSERDGARGVFDIWCSDMDGKRPRQITKHDGQENLLEAAISPDGGWAAFEVAGTRDPESNKLIGTTIWKIRLDGSGIQQLTRGADDRRPSWSDDGAKIYFQRRGTSWDMFSMDADGKNPEPLLRTAEEDETYPTRLASTDAFVLVESASGTSPRLKLFNDADKSGIYLTDGASGPETSPSVTPDGKIVAFLAPVEPDRPDQLGIWLIPIESF